MTIAFHRQERQHKHPSLEETACGNNRFLTFEINLPTDWNPPGLPQAGGQHTTQPRRRTAHAAAPKADVGCLSELIVGHLIGAIRKSGIVPKLAWASSPERSARPRVAIGNQPACRSAKRPANVPARIKTAPNAARLVTGSDKRIWARAKPNSGSVPIRKPTLVGLVRRTAAFWT